MLGVGMKLSKPCAALLMGPICWAAPLAQCVSVTVGNGVLAALNGTKSVGTLAFARQNKPLRSSSVGTVENVFTAVCSFSC